MIWKSFAEEAGRIETLGDYRGESAQTKKCVASRGSDKAKEVQKWFARAVTHRGEAYTIDLEQAAAVADESPNAIVVARAGSGKTRTIVAKIVYLVARCGIKPDEIMTFVFNSNAATEINARLREMRVDGVPVIGTDDAEAKAKADGVKTDDAEAKAKMKADGVKTEVASTFHAFSRKIVYEVCGGAEKCGKILAGEKEAFVRKIVQNLAKDPNWGEKVRKFIGADEIDALAKMMTQFINRAQQKFLAGENTLKEQAERRLSDGAIDARERGFIEIGCECYRRYHLLLLSEKAKLKGFQEYGTDFNLLVSWASKLIEKDRKEARRFLRGKKYILIDEYQDFSQLFLAVVMAIRRILPEARLFVVGDDWQAINRFAGSEVEYFKEFERYFPDGAHRYEITTNYRCNAAIVDAARGFMEKAMGEKGDFKAKSRRAGKVIRVEPEDMPLEYAVVDYDLRVTGRDRIYKEMTRKMLSREPKEETVQYIKTIAQLIKDNKKAAEILILHRNNEMTLEGIRLERLKIGLKWGLRQLKVMSTTEFDEKVQIMTMHKSKGLEAEVVILLECDEGVMPKTHPDTYLYAIFGETEANALDDQKRLFYVAMTRAKKKLYIIHRKKVEKSAKKSKKGLDFTEKVRYNG